MNFENTFIPYIITILFVAFLLVILLSVAIYFFRILSFRIIYNVEIKFVQRGGDSAKHVISLYKWKRYIDSFLSFFQCCEIGLGFKPTVRHYLPKAKVKKPTQKAVALWVEITLIFFLLLNPYYTELILSRIPRLNTELLGRLAVTAKTYLTVATAAGGSVVISGASKVIKGLSSKGSMKKSIIKDVQREDCAKLLGAHKRIRGILSQIEEDESYEIEELMRSIKSQPSFYIRETIEEKIPELSYNYSTDKYVIKRDGEFVIDPNIKALTMHENDIRERKIRIEESIKEIHSIIESYNSHNKHINLSDIWELDRKTGRSYASIKLDLMLGLTDCISRAKIIEQANNRISDDMIDLYSDEELVDYSNRILSEMQKILYWELLDGIELLVRMRNYINAFDEMYTLSK